MARVSQKEKLNAKHGVRRAGSWRDGEPPTSIPAVASGDASGKVNAIAEAMRGLQWRASHAKHYAAAWSVHIDTIRQYANEAHRLVAREVEDPSRATSTVVTYLEAALAKAWEDGDMRAIGDLSRTWSTIVGAVAPSRVQVSAVVADLQKLSSDELRAAGASLAEAVSRRLALAAPSAEPDGFREPGPGGEET